MEIGELFHGGGYDQSARINFADEDGYVLVMHNNSSHFIVATRDESIEIANDYMFVQSFDYSKATSVDEDGFSEVRFQYRRALGKAVQVALER